MPFGPPNWWLLNRMVHLTNKTLDIIEEGDKKILANILNNDNVISGNNTLTGNNIFTGDNVFTGDNTFEGNLYGNTQLNIQSNLVINGETTFNGNVRFDGNINSNNTLNIESNVSINNSLTVNDASTFNDTLNIKEGGITLGNLSTFNGNVIFNGNVRFDGGFTETFRETITANTNYILLNANIREQGFTFTYPAGIVIETHNSSIPRGYLFFDLSADRFWDLSGDHLNGNIIKAETLIGNIINITPKPGENIGSFGNNNEFLNNNYSSAAFGYNNTISGNLSFAFGSYNTLMKENTGCFGNNNIINGVNSFGSGYNNTITGQNAFVSGELHSISGKNSAAVGFNQIIDGNNSFACGHENIIIGDNTLGFGKSGNLFGENSLIGGYDNTIRGNNSLASGTSANVSGDNSLAIGTSANVSGINSLACGIHSNVAGTNSLACGSNNTITGNSAVVFGEYNRSSGDKSLVCGYYNDYSTEAIFQIGNGNSTSSRNNIFYVTHDEIIFNGNVKHNNQGLLSIKNIDCSNINVSGYISATNYFNIGSYLSKYLKVINTHTNDVGYNITDLSNNQNLVNSIFSKTKFCTLSHPINNDLGHWTTGIDLNILSSGYYTGIMQDYQNFKFAVSYKVTDNSVYEWDNKYSSTFPNQNDEFFSFQGQDPQTIYIKEFKTWDINFYFIGRWKRQLDSSGNPVTQNINEFEIAIFNSPTNNPNYQTDVRYVLDMTISKPSNYTTITI